MTRRAESLIALVLALSACTGTGHADASEANVRQQAAVDGQVRVNEFLSYTPARHTALLRLIAGYGAYNDTLNFNGGAHGSHTLVVPVGWRLEASFRNDAELPHSAEVSANVGALPEMPEPIAMPGGHTDAMSDGIGHGETGSMSFVASIPGTFLIVCGVPNHAMSGMWIRFIVSPTATAPSYEQTPTAAARPASFD